MRLTGLPFTVLQFTGLGLENESRLVFSACKPAADAALSGCAGG
jgi:hypothetical protein